MKKIVCFLLSFVFLLSALIPSMSVLAEGSDDLSLQNELYEQDYNQRNGGHVLYKGTEYWVESSNLMKKSAGGEAEVIAVDFQYPNRFLIVNDYFYCFEPNDNYRSAMAQSNMDYHAVDCFDFVRMDLAVTKKEVLYSGIGIVDTVLDFYPEFHLSNDFAYLVGYTKEHGGNPTFLMIDLRDGQVVKNTEFYTQGEQIYDGFDIFFVYRDHFFINMYRENARNYENVSFPAEVECEERKVNDNSLVKSIWTTDIGSDMALGNPAPFSVDGIVFVDKSDVRWFYSFADQQLHKQDFGQTSSGKMKPVTKTIENFNIDGEIGNTTFSFDPNLFKEDSKEFRIEIARFAANFVMLGYATENDIRNAFRAFGFQSNNFKIGNVDSSSVELKTGRDQVNNFISHYVAPDGSYCLLFVGMIGSFHAQWDSNFDPNGTKRESRTGSAGKPGPLGDTHEGFLDAKKYTQNRVEHYVKQNNLMQYGDKLKILITGHSRGAAAANLFAADLLQGKGGIENMDKKNVFAYTFATPNNVSKEKTSGEKYKRIFNIVNPEDFVTYVLPEKWGYSKYGTTFSLPTKSEMWKQTYLGLRNDMQKYYSMMRPNKVYYPYEKGALATISVVEAMTIGFNRDEYYTQTNYCSVTPFVFFQKLLCPLVNKSGDSPDMETLVEALVPRAATESFNEKRINVKHIDVDTVLSHFAYAQILAFFIGNQGTKAFVDMINDELKKGNNDKDSIARDISTAVKNLYLLDEIVLQMTGASNLPQSYFEEAHRMETYCAWVMSLSKENLMGGSRFWFYKLRCPVDVEIYEKDSGDLVARVTNNTVDETIAAKENAVGIEVVGESKEFLLPDSDEYEVVVIGNDDGTMSCSVDLYGANGSQLSRTNYPDVTVSNGAKMYFRDTAIVDDNGNVLCQGAQTSVDEMKAVNLTVQTEGNGYAVGEGSYLPGDCVTLSSISGEGATFLGWYDGDTQISDQPVYAYVVKGDAQLTAKFTGDNAAPIEIEEPDTAGRGLKVWHIILIAIGGLIVAAGAAFLVWFLLKKKWKM